MLKVGNTVTAETLAAKGFEPFELTGSVDGDWEQLIELSNGRSAALYVTVEGGKVINIEIG